MKIKMDYRYLCDKNALTAVGYLARLAFVVFLVLIITLDVDQLLG